MSIWSFAMAGPPAHSDAKEGRDQRHPYARSTITLLIIPAIIIAASFTLYLQTANPLFRFSDGGELAAASYTLGIAHPTGYPAFLMLQKTWSFLVPIGNPCFRANLMSALCASIALALIYLFTLRIAGLIAGLVAAGLFAMSETFWLQATQSTVYTLNLMLGALLILVAFRALHHPATLQMIALFFLVLGFGLGNHVTLLLVPIALLVSHPFSFGRILGRKTAILTALIFLMVGLSIYLYMPLRAQQDPPINWGDTSISERMWEHISQQDYKFKQASRTTGEYFSATGTFFASIANELGIVGAILALIGLVHGIIKRDTSSLLFFVVLALGTLMVALLYGERDELEPIYCLPAYLAAAALAGLGANLILKLCSGVRRASGQLAPRKAFISLCAIVLLVLPPMVLGISNYHRCDSSQN
ncbi:MAG: DUF2723 domain-containing protein, partial [Candidatus Coatesbacteria bacterium]|nr:DUF2723 domain-containing protein [Candidatus Coatesbacteria bacterium]